MVHSITEDMWATLPDVPFAGVRLTMPDVLWPVFRRNRHLTDNLPALGTAVIREWAKDSNRPCP